MLKQMTVWHLLFLLLFACFCFFQGAAGDPVGPRRIWVNPKNHTLHLISDLVSHKHSTRLKRDIQGGRVKRDITPTTPGKQLVPIVSVGVVLLMSFGGIFCCIEIRFKKPDCMSSRAGSAKCPQSLNLKNTLKLPKCPHRDLFRSRRDRPHCAPQPPKNLYEDAVSMEPAPAQPRPTINSSGYTEVEFVLVDSGSSSMETEPSEYNVLQNASPQRAMSDPQTPQRAYDHVFLPQRSIKIQKTKEDDGAKESQMTQGNVYDVSVVAADSCRVKVIGEVYDKLKN